MLQSFFCFTEPYQLHTMRTLLIIGLILTLFNSYGQEKKAIDASALTDSEASYLNWYLKSKRGNFNFEGKKIAFIGGSGGSRILSKGEYFEQVKKNAEAIIRGGGTFIVLLDEKEKLNSGGYDAFVTLWVKTILSKSKIFKKLN